MTLPARRRAPLALTLAAAAAASLAGPLSASAQQPPAAAAPSASSAQPAAATPAPAKKPEAKGTAVTGEQAEKDAGSYSLGLMWGEQARNNGVSADAVSVARIAQGVRDGISGKAKLSDKDRDNIRGLAKSLADSNHRAATRFLAANGKKPGIVTTASGLEYQELRTGSGDSPKMGDTVSVNYRGTLLDGTEFDSSYKRGLPADFEVGHVIPGWNEAMQLMKPGAKWKLFIPPQLAYDLRPPQGSGIGPGSMLVFEVELLSVKPPAPPAPAAPASPPPAPK
jgi:FKBP-type peptidyl-prolyl cis-trans isomerase